MEAKAESEGAEMRFMEKKGKHLGKSWPHTAFIICGSSQRRRQREEPTQPIS